MNDELHRRQIALEQAMGVRNRFYASMSHELRTPINAVIGYSTLMLDNIYGPLNDKQKEGLQRTLKAARHLLELVNDVLDLSKIEAGKIELSLQPVMFPSLIEDLFVTVRPLADEYGSSLALEMEGESFNIVTDPRRVRQILLNLLSNAIKFGEGKPIRVLCKQNEAKGVEIDVVDHGSRDSEGRHLAHFRGVRSGLGIEAARHRSGPPDFEASSSAVGWLADRPFDPWRGQRFSSHSAGLFRGRFDADRRVIRRYGGLTSPRIWHRGCPSYMYRRVERGSFLEALKCFVSS